MNSPHPFGTGGQGRSPDQVRSDGEGALFAALIFLLVLGTLFGLVLAGVIE